MNPTIDLIPIIHRNAGQIGIYVKELLGHFDIETTERYLHVSRKELVNIISPLDDLWRKGKIDW